MGIKFLREGGSGEIVEKKSRFIGTAFPVSSEEEALTCISQVRKKYYDARHHCYAYVIGDKNEVMKQSDDGEPSQTAGMPILDVLKKEEIHNALIVVTRYFGGTLLGTGGLVRAYTQGAKAALEASQIMEAIDGYRVTATMNYNLVGKIQYIAGNLSIKEESAEYGADVTLTYLIPKAQLESFQKQVTEASSGTIFLASEACRWYNGESR